MSGKLKDKDVETEKGIHLGKVKTVNFDGKEIESVEVYKINNQNFPRVSENYSLTVPSRDVVEIEGNVLLRDKAFEKIKNTIYESEKEFQEAKKKRDNKNKKTEAWKWIYRSRQSYREKIQADIKCGG